MLTSPVAVQIVLECYITHTAYYLCFYVTFSLLKSDEELTELAMNTAVPCKNIKENLIYVAVVFQSSVSVSILIFIFSLCGYCLFGSHPKQSSELLANAKTN